MNAKPESQQQLDEAYINWKNNPPKPKKAYTKKKSQAGKLALYRSEATGAGKIRRNQRNLIEKNQYSVVSPFMGCPIYQQLINQLTTKTQRKKPYAKKNRVATRFFLQQLNKFGLMVNKLG